MKILIMSDIHGNQQALETVLEYVGEKYTIDEAMLLGDIIDYGMHSNEVVEVLEKMQWPVCVNIRGNHEEAILNDCFDGFSSLRGQNCAKYTKSILNDATLDYLCTNLESGPLREFSIGDRKCLAVHGSLENPAWGNFSDTDLGMYSEYDYVFTGHSHQPHFFEMFYTADNPLTRNQKKTIFVNPGSVGQPRNLNARAQFAILDTKTEEIILAKVPYDIKTEQSSYNGKVDKFYRDRLEMGV